jgi:hypothetical protein
MRLWKDKWTYPLLKGKYRNYYSFLYPKDASLRKFLDMHATNICEHFICFSTYVTNSWIRASPTEALKFGAVKVVCSVLDPDTARGAAIASPGAVNHRAKMQR